MLEPVQRVKPGSMLVDVKIGVPKWLVRCSPAWRQVLYPNPKDLGFQFARSSGEIILRRNMQSRRPRVAPAAFPHGEQLRVFLVILLVSLGA